VKVVRGRTLVVGDIHGCHREFLALLERVRFSADDALVAVGDIVDRGPGSVALLAFFRDTPNAFSVLGNHERRLARVIREGPKRGAWSQLATIETMPPGDRVGWADFLESLPAVIETPHAIVTHARLDPALPLTAQDPYYTCAVGGARVTIPLSQDGVPLWFPERHWEKPVCIGHIGYERAELVPGRLFALDTHAVAGGQLTMVSFPDERLRAVDVGTNYHAAALAAWKRKRLGHDDPAGWSLKSVLRFLEETSAHTPAGGTDGEEDPARARLDALLQPILGRANHLRPVLAARFGDMPPPGPERGDYFRQARDLAQDPLQRSIVSRLLSARPLSLSELARTARNASLSEIAIALEALEQKLGGENGARDGLD
jgi:hypothetical protein